MVDARVSRRRRVNAASATDPDINLPEVAPGTGALGGRTFAQWVQIGLAVTLPLLIFGLIALITFMWMAAKAP